MTQSQAQEALKGEIVADARRQVERLVRHAKDEADEALRKANQEAEKIRTDRAEAAKNEAQRQRDLVLASLPVQVGRMRSDRMEAALRAILDEARQKLVDRQGFDYRAVLLDMAVDAIGHMEGTSFVLDLSEADLKDCAGWLPEEVKRKVGRGDIQVSVAPEAARIAGGVIVRDAEGRQLLDNSLASRLERLWPAMRRQIGGLAFKAVAP